MLNTNLVKQKRIHYYTYLFFISILKQENLITEEQGESFIKEIREKDTDTELANFLIKINFNLQNMESFSWTLRKCIMINSNNEKEKFEALYKLYAGLYYGRNRNPKNIILSCCSLGQNELLNRVLFKNCG